MLDHELAATYAGWFRALADPTRVQILNLLAESGDAMTVDQIIEQVAVGQSTVSAHLKILTDARFVPSEPRGRLGSTGSISGASTVSRPPPTSSWAAPSPPSTRSPPTAPPPPRR